MFTMQTMAVWSMDSMPTTAPQQTSALTIPASKAMSKTTLIACMLSSMTTGLSAADYYVATTGSNTANGSATAPWQTIVYAASQGVAGDVVHVHDGTYNERVVFPNSGSQSNYIVFRAVDGASPIVDGSGLSISGRQGLFEFKDRSYLRIEGFTLKHYISASRNAVPVGILIEGGGDGLEIVSNKIESIASTATVNKNLLGRDAHGIAVYGNSATPITDLLIRDNELKNLTLGSSEAMVINGNVDGFRVLDNYVHDCDNIGIDAIGYEGTGPTDELDQARNGLIARNVIENITSIDNPAYGGETSAGGIYVDGGRDIVIERNIVSNCNIGIEVASEHFGKVTSGIIVRSNLLRENQMAGLFIGGYNANATGDADNCLIAHNTFYNNDTDASADEYGQIYIQYRVSNTSFVSNILYHDITKSGGYNIFIVQWNATDEAIDFDRNLYYGPGTPVSVISNDWVEGFASYQALALSGSNETWGDPLFTAAEMNDFTLQGASPAIDLGDASVISNGERDLLNHERIQALVPDAGAIEHGSAAPAAGTLSIDQSDRLSLNWTIPAGAFYTLQQCYDLQTWLTLPGHDSETSNSGAESLGALPIIAQKQFFRVTFE
jgi:hypothetical protein